MKADQSPAQTWVVRVWEMVGYVVGVDLLADRVHVEALAIVEAVATPLEYGAFAARLRLLALSLPPVNQTLLVVGVLPLRAQQQPRRQPLSLEDL